MNAGWVSGITLQNASSATFYTDYYNASGSFCRSYGYSINGYYPQVIYPAPPDGSQCTSSTVSAILGRGSQPLAANVNQIKPGTSQATTYAAVAVPSRTVIVPLLRRQNGWDDGFVVQNVNSTSAAITVTYYNINGQQPNSLNYTLAPRESRVFYGSQIPLSEGSAVITADRPIAVSVNHWKNGAGGDEIASHPAVHR